MVPNMIAYAAMIIWPLVTLGMFLTLSTSRAIIWSILLSYLILPPYITVDLPGLPAFDKNTIAALSTLLLAAVMAKRGDFRWPKSTALNILVIVYLFSPIVTGLLNRDPIVIMAYTKTGIDFYTSLTSCLNNFIFFAPFLLGVGFLHKEGAARDLLIALVLCALAYSIPVLLEIRLSPFFARSVYGIRTIYFMQQMRGSGFRSMVFLGHGLLVSDFLAFATLASVGLMRMRKAVWNIPTGAIVAFLFVMLVLNKSLGALLLAILVAPMVYYLRPRRLALVGVIVSCLFLSFPLSRTLGLIPINLIESAASQVSSERAQSFAFRAMNEEALLSRAEERPLFGWGPYARWRIREVTTMGEVKDVTTSDGLWIITLGQYGWAGFIGLFGLLCYPLWRAYKVVKVRPLPMVALPLMGIVTFQLINLIPNPGLVSVVWLVAGTLTGLLAPQAQAVVRRRLAGGTAAVSPVAGAKPVAGGA